MSAGALECENLGSECNHPIEKKGNLFRETGGLRSRSPSDREFLTSDERVCVANQARNDQQQVKRK